MSLRMKSRAAALAATLALTATLATAPGAVARPAAEPSTPVPMNTPDGQVFSYVVNTKQATVGQVRRANKAIRASGGVVVKAWNQIGVVIAHSKSSNFRRDVVTADRGAIASVGSVRSVPVTEGTPVANPWAATPSAKTKANSPRPVNQDSVSARTEIAADPRESEQWDLAAIGADRAHQITDGSPKVLVGVLDSGIDPDHPDLRPNIDVANSVNCSNAGRPDTSPQGWWPTTSDHGTHVAGTIAAARNGIGIVGVAPGVKLASVKVVNDDGYIYPEYAICGFMWAGLHGMDVTNNSYFVDPFMYWCGDQPDQAAGKEAVRRAVAWATGQGVVHAAAAGNAATDLAHNVTDDSSPNDAASTTARTINDECHDIPAELDGVVAVSSTTQAGDLSSFSNRGLGVIDVAAPGSAILSTVITDNGYGLKSGTSMASPHVAGVLALMKSAHPGWGPAKMITQLKAQATNKPCPDAECQGTTAVNGYFGDGLVNALAAVR